MKKIPKPKFMEEVYKYLNTWYHKQSLLTLSVSGLIVMVMVGGLFFWVTQFSYAFTNQHGKQEQLDIATSGLQTMKRMVGDDQIWAESIQKEYSKIFTNPPFDISTNYNGNFVGQDVSTNQSCTR